MILHWPALDLNANPAGLKTPNKNLLDCCILVHECVCVIHRTHILGPNTADLLVQKCTRRFFVQLSLIFTGSLSINKRLHKTKLNV